MTRCAHRSDEAARRNDDAPLATDVFDEGQCDISEIYKHALHHETFKGCSINYGMRNVQKKVLTFWSVS